MSAPRIANAVVSSIVPPIEPLCAWGWREPSVLFWSLVVAIPILIHLYGRLTIRRVDFPAVRFLPETAVSRRSPDRIREILLLLLQCAILLLLVTAAAIPQWRSMTRIEPLTTAQSPVCRIFVLDGSASMFAEDQIGRNSFERAKRRVQEILAEKTENTPESTAGERLGLLLAGDSPELEMGRLTSRRTEFLRRLERLQCTRGEADLRGVLTQLLQWLNDRTFLKPDERCEIILLSDLDAATWKGYDATRSPTSFLPEWTEVAEPLAQRAEVRLEPVGDPPSENVGLTELQIETVPESAASNAMAPPRQVRVKVTYRGGLRPKTESVTLRVDGIVVGRREVSLAPDATIPIEFDPVPIGVASENFSQENGYGEFNEHNEYLNEESVSVPNRSNQIEVSKSPDRFPPDDQCRELIRGSDRIRILLVNASPDPESIRWLATALAPLGDVGPVRMTPVSLTELPFANPERFDGVVLFDTPISSAIPAETNLVLQHYLEQGGRVLIFPADDEETQGMDSDNDQGTGSEPFYVYAESRESKSRESESTGSEPSTNESELSSVSNPLVISTMAGPQYERLRTDVSDIDRVSIREEYKWFPAIVGEFRNRPQTAIIRDEPDGSDAGLFDRFTGTSVAEVPILRYRSLTPSRNSQTLWRSTEGEPLLVESSYGSGQTLMFAIRPIPADSPLVVLPAFVPLIQETLRWFCTAERRPRDPTESLPAIPTTELGFRFLTHNADFGQAVRNELGWCYGATIPTTTETVSPSHSTQTNEISPTNPTDSSNVPPSITERSTRSRFPFLHSPEAARWLTPTKFLITLAILLWLANLYLTTNGTRNDNPFNSF